jgi:hypothetical protein
MLLLYSNIPISGDVVLFRVPPSRVRSLGVTPAPFEPCTVLRTFSLTPWGIGNTTLCLNELR